MERSPSVTAISWSEPEHHLEEQEIQAFHDVLVEAAAPDITVCIASDNRCHTDSGKLSLGGVGEVTHPASDPLVLSCAATLIEDLAAVRLQDYTSLRRADVECFGSGLGCFGFGVVASVRDFLAVNLIDESRVRVGVSDAFGAPSYQSHGALSSISSGKPGRAVPDIAIYGAGITMNRCADKSDAIEVSVAAPLTASLICLANQANQAFGRSMGFLNPMLNLGN
jgi:kumamolisin